MKTGLASLLAVLFLAGFVAVAQAEEKKEVTIKGDIQCGKCKLNKAENCQNVVIVTEGDKKVAYWMVHDRVARDFHGKICAGEVIPVAVKGIVEEKDGKKVITAKEIKEAGQEVSLTGDIQCGKCKLNQAENCQNALIVSKGDHKTTYWLVHNTVARQFHGKICAGAVIPVTVKGTVEEKDGKKVVTATEIAEKS